MTDAAPTEPDAPSWNMPSEDIKPYSCLPCRQRKIKCDRLSPCSNCSRTQKQCSFVAPVRGKRKRTRATREGLHSRLRRYEELLRSCGVDVNSPHMDDEIDMQDYSPRDTPMSDEVRMQTKSQKDPYGLEETNSRLVTKEGSSRYFESALWSNLGDEFEHPENGSSSDLTDDTDVDESDLLFTESSFSKSRHIASLHPPDEVVSVMKEVFTDRVDPLLKVLHLPTFWSMLAEGRKNPERMHKSLQALIFSFYLVTIISLRDKECQDMLGLHRSTAIPHYRSISRRALTEAGLLSTSSPTTLQAYAIFMMCIRKSQKVETLYILSGVAIRLARKMGLHRDGTFLNLSPFETEMRRRLWWHLVAVDFRTADVIGTRPSLDLTSSDARMPLNVDDNDLSPEMTSLPAGRDGIFGITCSLVRSLMSDILQKESAGLGRGLRWDVLSNSDIPISKKESIINQMEDEFERKYLRYYDPSNALHTFFTIMVRSGICKMRLFAYRPSMPADNSTQQYDGYRDSMFANALKLLEYITFLQGDDRAIGKFAWQMGSSHLWITMLHVLIEIRYRKSGADIDKAWQLIGTVYSCHPQIFQESKSSVFASIGKWTLSVWDECVAASTSEGRSEVAVPEYIVTLSQLHKTNAPSQPRVNKAADAVLPNAPTRSLAYGTPESLSQEKNSELALLDSYDFADFESFTMPENELAQWEQLFAGPMGY